MKAYYEHDSILYKVEVDDSQDNGFAWVTATAPIFPIIPSSKGGARGNSTFGQVALEELLFDDDCNCNGFNNPNGCEACTAELRSQYDEIPF